MVPARMFRREQQKQQIDRLIVGRVEIDGLRQPGEMTHNPVQAPHMNMRDRDSAPEPRRAETLALQ